MTIAMDKYGKINAFHILLSILAFSLNVTYAHKMFYSTQPLN